MKISTYGFPTALPEDLDDPVFVGKSMDSDLDAGMTTQGGARNSPYKSTKSLSKIPPRSVSDMKYHAYFIHLNVFISLCMSFVIFKL